MGLLNGTSQDSCLRLKIGNLGFELWNYPNEEAQPYIRLIFNRDIDDILGDNCQYGGERTVTLGWQEAFVLSGAIQNWLLSLDSGIEEYGKPALHVGIESVAFDFYRQSGNQGLKMICCLERAGELSRQVILTRSEASLLGQLLLWQGEAEEEQ